MLAKAEWKYTKRCHHGPNPGVLVLIIIFLFGLRGCLVVSQTQFGRFLTLTKIN